MFRDVAADDELLLQVRAELNPGTRSLAGFVGGTDSVPDHTLPNRACALPQELVLKALAVALRGAADLWARGAPFPAPRAGVRSARAATIPRRG